MTGKPQTTGTLQAHLVLGIAFLAQSGNLPAESTLVALTQSKMVVIEYISAQVITHPHRAHVPAPVHGQQEVTGQCHDGQLYHQVKEYLVTVLDDNVVGEAADIETMGCQSVGRTRT